ncbi:hypothetical protein V7127_21960 [Bacillus sp. JJ1773]
MRFRLLIRVDCPPNEAPWQPTCNLSAKYRGLSAKFDGLSANLGSLSANSCSLSANFPEGQ